MIKKERKAPIKLLKLEAMIKRLPQSHRMRASASEELAKLKAGYKGEQAIDYYLNDLPVDQYIILHGLRLAHSKTEFFQIDTLLLTQRCFFILEVKNISGMLYFDQTFNQLIRISGKNEEAFLDPIQQVKRQKSKLELFLKQYPFPPVPIHCLVVISNPSSLIKAKFDSVKNTVIHAGSLPEKLESFQNRYHEDLLTIKDLNKISHLLQKQHTSPKINILSQYDIEKSELIFGVKCPSCSRYPMNRINRSWFCPYCRKMCKKAHIEAFFDYVYLFGNTMKNKEMREFLCISSRQTVTRLLTSQTATQTGNQKNRKYILQLPD
ncbi:nuclease-related domain-containing protein [Metabacillus idriensis]|uniref:nuclease-related domain-containing protein n=1 Tax=Metabacillus idriensis TaxID=324768 RepID=UPI00174B085F|nr:nuclease-related domain-containing protein [Metabacillus idriensis]